MKRKGPLRFLEKLAIQLPAYKVEVFFFQKRQEHSSTTCSRSLSMHREWWKYLP
jgi:hypothetical protein